MLFSHNLSFFQVGWDRAVYQDVPACLGNQATWDCQARNGVKWNKKMEGGIFEPAFASLNEHSEDLGY